MMPGELPAPEWVMCGVPLPDGRKRLYASKSLGKASITHKPDTGQGPASWSLGVRDMVNLVIIDRPTYGECLAHLMMMWENELAERALPAGRMRFPAPWVPIADNAAIAPVGTSAPELTAADRGVHEHATRLHNAAALEHNREMERADRESRQYAKEPGFEHDCALQGCPGRNGACSCVGYCGMPACGGV